MIDDTYKLEFNDEYTVYEFDSVGTRGIIRKQVQYLLVGAENCYNLGFGDKDNLTNDIDDMVVTLIMVMERKCLRLLLKH